MNLSLKDHANGLRVSMFNLLSGSPLQASASLENFLQYLENLLFTLHTDICKSKFNCIFTGFGLPGFTTRELFFDLVVSLL